MKEFGELIDQKNSTLSRSSFGSREAEGRTVDPIFEEDGTFSDDEFGSFEPSSHYNASRARDDGLRKLAKSAVIGGIAAVGFSFLSSLNPFKSKTPDIPAVPPRRHTPRRQAPAPSAAFVCGAPTDIIVDFEDAIEKLGLNLAKLRVRRQPMHEDKIGSYKIEFREIMVTEESAEETTISIGLWRSAILISSEETRKHLRDVSTVSYTIKMHKSLAVVLNEIRAKTLRELIQDLVAQPEEPRIEDDTLSDTSFTSEVSYA